MKRKALQETREVAEYKTKYKAVSEAPGDRQCVRENPDPQQASTEHLRQRKRLNHQQQQQERRALHKRAHGTTAEGIDTPAAAAGTAVTGATAGLVIRFAGMEIGELDNGHHNEVAGTGDRFEAVLCSDSQFAQKDGSWDMYGTITWTDKRGIRQREHVEGSLARDKSLEMKTTWIDNAHVFDRAPPAADCTEHNFLGFARYHWKMEAGDVMNGSCETGDPDEEARSTVSVVRLQGSTPGYDSLRWGYACVSACDRGQGPTLVISDSRPTTAREHRTTPKHLVMCISLQMSVFTTRSQCTVHCRWQAVS